MILPNQQQFQTLLSRRVFQTPTLTCSIGNPIVRLCSNDECTYDAVCCDKDYCENCQVAHKYCPTIKIKSLNRKVEERLNLHKSIFRNLFKIENDLLKKLNEDRKQLIESSKFWNLDGGSSKLVDSIYSKNSSEGIKGKNIKNLLAQFSQKQKEIDANQYTDEYRRLGDKIIERLSLLRSTIIQGLIKPKGSIILSNDDQGWKKYSYLMKQLDNPSQLKLLFRASQHKFNAQKFHQYCDGIPDTVTIVRTEFGKTIAAYTPLQWGTIQGDYIADDNKRSFLLQLELRQKMTLIQPQKAICNYQIYGPTFGGGHDLKIADFCHQNQNSFCNFPTSYNCNGKYKNGQQSYSVFCGNPNGYKFRVVQYEVFAVCK